MSWQSRILIVDDHPTNVAILEEILAEAYEVETAVSGEAALAIAPDFQPALILLDVMMPGIDGYETCRRLRAHPVLRYAKIIMVSAKALVAERLEGYEAGANDYITKPFDEEELLAKVRVYLQLKTLEEVDQLKSDVLTLLSHETRTPLSSILLALNLLGKEELGAQERQRVQELGQKSVERLRQFFEKIMTLSAMKSGSCEFQFTPGDLCDVVRAAIGEVVSDASTQQAPIEVELPQVVPMLLDQKKMRGVIVALLENARRFTAAPGCIRVRSWQADHTVTVTVTDQGPGIEPAFLPHIFEEFTDPDVMHHTDGQGLSLAIARQIVQAHQGTLRAESTKGVGTTFTIQLPSRALAADDATPTQASVA